MRDVAVIGIGIAKWGELWSKSLRDIYVETAQKAIADATVDHIDAMYVGCMSGGLFVGQEHLGALLADYLGMAGIPSTRVESACASGGVAFKMGFLDVASGASDLVLVGGIEKMTDVGSDQATYALATAADQEYEVYQGITFPGLYAMMARAHMQTYGTTREQIAQVAVKNHRHGNKNPNAQFPQIITLEEVLNSTLVAEPLRILDCSPITDGAAAVILCPLEKAKNFSSKPLIKISAIGHATDTIALHSRSSFCDLASVKKAASLAYKTVKINPDDIDFAEVHDCFTIAEIMIIEALGFVEAGKGGSAAESGLTAFGGKIPVNVSGGLKSKGHPVGATGVAQICELVTQLRGEAGARQIANARIGLAQNMGGSGASSVVSILEVI